MRISPLYPRVVPIPPLFIAPPPPPEKKPDEPISFCGQLNRLLAIHRRHTMMERMMFWMSKIGMFFGFGATVTTGRFSKLA